MNERQNKTWLELERTIYNMTTILYCKVAGSNFLFLFLIYVKKVLSLY